MGSSCAKSYQSERYTKIEREKPQLLSQENSVILIIHENLEGSSRASVIDRQNSIEFRCEFNDSSYQKSFTPRIGFELSQKNSHFKNNQFSFKKYKTDEQNDIFEIDTSAYGSEILWKRVSSTSSQLLINDHIKLGGNVLKLKYFLNQDQIRAMKQGSEDIQIKRADHQDNVCRLCKNHQQGKQEKLSPYIIPCKCTGASQIVHQNCLSREIFDQSVTLDDYKMAFRFVVKKTQCQFCHESLQTYIWKRFLANLVIHEGYYAIFQRKVSSDINVVEHTEFFVIRFVLENQQIKLGRSNTCHCSIPEEDIQKVHATLKVKNGFLHIYDDGSQTGTFSEHHGNKLILGEEYYYDRFSFQTKIKNMKEHSCSTRTYQQIKYNRIRA